MDFANTFALPVVTLGFNSRNGIDKRTGTTLG